MPIQSVSAFFAERAAPLAVILGTNEIASAVAARLCREGYAVVLSHDPFPPVIRRGMAFHDALFGDKTIVDGVEGLNAETAVEIADALGRVARVAVTRLELSDLLALRAIDVLVDARMQKHRITPDYRFYVRRAIGLGANFVVGENCDFAIETRPNKNGVLVADGSTDSADGVQPPLGGVGRERFVYCDRPGLWRTPVEIGMRVFRGFPVGRLAGARRRAHRRRRARSRARWRAYAGQREIA